MNPSTEQCRCGNEAVARLLWGTRCMACIEESEYTPPAGRYLALRAAVPPRKAATAARQLFSTQYSAALHP